MACCKRDVIPGPYWIHSNGNPSTVDPNIKQCQAINRHSADWKVRHVSFEGTTIMDCFNITIENFWHSILWDAITYPCLRYLLLVPKSSFMEKNGMIQNHGNKQNRETLKCYLAAPGWKELNASLLAINWDLIILSVSWLRSWIFNFLKLKLFLLCMPCIYSA